MARLPRHLSALCLCVMTLMLQCHLPSASDDVQPPGRFKRNSDPIQEFLEAVKTNPVDLIILMERSVNVGRHRFYLRARKLVSYVLRYYVKMGPFDVKLVVASFAGDVKVHINGMKDTSVRKCDIWDQHWDDVVLVDKPETFYNMAHLKIAYEKAEDIFIKYGSNTGKKYIWLLTSGNYRMDEDLYNPRPIAAKLMNMGVQIVATKVGGVEGNKDNIEQVVSSSLHHGGEVADWITTLTMVDVITDAPDLVRSSTASLCHCEQSFGFTICGGCQNEPCGNENICTKDCICTNPTLNILCPKANTRQVCPIYSGQTGRYCQLKVKECVQGTCANNGTCHEDQNSYTCTCPPPYLPQFLCETFPVCWFPPDYRHCPNPAKFQGEGHSGVCKCHIMALWDKSGTIDNDTDPASGMSVGPSVGGALGALILIIIIVGGVCIWKKKRRPPTQDATTNTTPSRTNTTSTLSSLNIFDIFRRKKGVQTPPNLTIGSYLEVQSLPPAIPKTLPPATVRYLSKKPKPRSSLGKFLQYIPEHLHPSTHQEEIEKPVSIIMDHKAAGAAGADDDDDDEGGDYENVGSKNMPGWENYVMKLATEGCMRNFAIIRYDREAYVTTCEIWLLPTKDELSHIYNVLLSRKTGEYIKIKSARYKVTKNNGKMMESWLEGRTPDVLCVGRSKQYLALGVETDRTNTGSCYQEVGWVRENLSKQGK